MKHKKIITTALSLTMIMGQWLHCPASSLTINAVHTGGLFEFTYSNRLYSNTPVGAYVEYRREESDDTGELVYITQGVTDDMGMFSCRDIETPEYGFYTLYVEPMHGVNTEEYHFAYFTPEETERRVFKKINRLDEYSGYAEADEAVLTGLKYLDGQNAGLCNEINTAKQTDEKFYRRVISMFCSSHGHIEDENDFYSELSSAIRRAREKDAIAQIKAIEHISQIESLIVDEKIADILGITEIAALYKELYTKDRVNEYIKNAKFDTAEEFRMIFKQAMDLYAKEDGTSHQKPKPGNKGGGGSFGASGGGASSSMIYNAESVPKPVPFADIDGVTWAKTYIIKLYSLGFIDGKTADTFAPNDAVKREEFVKLAVNVFELNAEGDGLEFKDVDVNQWYSPYIKIASACKIVNGMGDGVFGVGECATRQDMAVMLYNCLKNASDDFTSSIYPSADNVPKDMHTISDYAKEAVAALFAEGIIKGNSMGFFEPSKNATRAECAVMLCRIYDKFIEGGADK